MTDAMCCKPAEGRIDAIYARQSIDKADSISIESQIEFCRYETRGNTSKVFWDKGYSGKNTERPGFQKMLQEIKCGKIQRVVCYKLDRCSRSILDFASMIDIFQKYGVDFVSCTEKFDTSTPMGRAMLNICIVFAQLERETIQQRVTDAYHSRCKKGFYMGGRIPFGYRLTPCLIENKQTSCYEAVPQEAEIIEFLYRKYSDPAVSLKDLVCFLKQASIDNPRRADGLWVTSHIGRMLSNPIYVKADTDIYRYFQDLGVTICSPRESFVGMNGCYMYTGKDSGRSLVLAPHPGIVSSELWLRCRKKHTALQKRFFMKCTDTWISGKLKCACCERTAVITETKKHSGKKYRYIVCPNSHGSDRFCTGIHGWKPETAETILSQLLLNRMKTGFSELSDTIYTGSQTNNSLSENVLQLQRSIEDLSEQGLTSGSDMLPELQNQLRDLHRQKTQLLHKLMQNDRQKKNMIIPDYDKLWQTWSPDIRSRLLDAMVHSIYLSRDRIHIHWKL